MKDIEIYPHEIPQAPTMIAGWPGMGNVALGVVGYLQKKLDLIKLADIRLDPAIALDSVAVEDGVAKFPLPPRNTFYYNRSHNLIIFEGDIQLPGQAGIDLLNKVLGLAKQFGVRRIYTGAAFPMPVSHKDVPEIYGAVNDRKLSDIFLKYGINKMEGGHISGLNGLLLGYARQWRIEAICLLATIPQYAVGLPNPKASMYIIETISRMASLKVDLSGMDHDIMDIDEKMALIEEKVKIVLALEENESSQHSESKVPQYAMDRIEKLFREAKIDKAKAFILKKELDRWDLYKLYEDRFLDLFKDSQ